MIATSNYKNCNTDEYDVYSISKDCGKDAGYEGKCYLALAPKKEFFKKWRHDIGKVDEMENNEYYMREFYNQVLKVLEPDEVYEQLNNSVLLCYEEHNEFCHRHLVAAWLELSLGVEVPEVKINGRQIEKINRPFYIKKYLEQLIDSNFAKKNVKKKI